MIAVIAAMRRQIERHRQTHLALCQVAPVEGIDSSAWKPAYCRMVHGWVTYMVG